MELEFLKQFPKRMKTIGAYAYIFKNSISKGTWKQYGFEEFYEQTNITFAVLLYIMEQSLKNEPCTMDDIGSFIDNSNMRWFKKSLSYEECKALGDFIVNIILCDEGKAMYFKGYDFEENDYTEIHISFVANRIVYLEEEIKRTSYYLTEDGYNLLLSTLEIEGNLKLTIHEMIFKLHLEKASYDKAAEDIKNIFNLLRIQLQKMQEAMNRIRQNALRYSVQDYKELLEENLNTLSDTKLKFREYRDIVNIRVQELEERDINIHKLDKKDSDNLTYLKSIESFLNRALDEQQKILITHFDLKSLYAKELESLSQMSFVKRYHFRYDFYDKLLENPSSLEKIDLFLRPLYSQTIPQIYNMNKALEPQKALEKKEMEEETEILTFDEEEWIKEQNRIASLKHIRYKNSLTLLLSKITKEKEISLKQLIDKLTEQEVALLIPNIEVFKEIMIELIKNKRIEIQGLLEEEQQEKVREAANSFQLSEYILEVQKNSDILKEFKSLHINRLEGERPVVIEGILNERGIPKKIVCSNLIFTMENKDENALS